MDHSAWPRCWGAQSSLLWLGASSLKEFDMYSIVWQPCLLRDCKSISQMATSDDSIFETSDGACCAWALLSQRIPSFQVPSRESYTWPAESLKVGSAAAGVFIDLRVRCGKMLCMQSVALVAQTGWHANRGQSNASAAQHLWYQLQYHLSMYAGWYRTLHSEWSEVCHYETCWNEP